MKIKLIKFILISLVITLGIPLSAEAYFSDTEIMPFIFETGTFDQEKEDEEKTENIDDSLDPEEEIEDTSLNVFYFSDEETEGNDFTAGTLDIEVELTEDSTNHFYDMAPGVWGIANINICNVGSSNIDYNIWTEWNDGNEQLYNAIKAKIYDATDVLIGGGENSLLKDLNTSSRFLEAGECEEISFYVNLTSNTDNSYQDLQTKFNLIFFAIQEGAGEDENSQEEIVVTFPDSNLEAAIREAIEKPTGDIYQSDLEKLTRFFAPAKDIYDLTGLEYCVNLIELYFCNNRISDISSLSSLTNLTELCLDGNQISDTSSLSLLTNLTWLNLSHNQISDGAIMGSGAIYFWREA